MKRALTTLLLVGAFISLKGQGLPDRIVVLRNTYRASISPNPEVFSNTQRIVITDKRQIVDLVALFQFDDEDQLLSKFEIDTSLISNNPETLLQLYDGSYRDKIAWNQKQKDFIYEKLKDINTYKSGISNYLSIGCCYTMHNSYRYDYVITLYSAKHVTNVLTSRKSRAGYYFPYKDQSNRLVYNFAVDKLLAELFKLPDPLSAPLKGNDIMKFVVNHVVDDSMHELYKLSAYSYEKEISELSTDFEIVHSEEVYARGRYIWDEPPTIQISLKNSLMMPNVYIQFLASQYGQTLYSRDSIKKDYRRIISRVQSIPFLTNYLRNDPSAKLDIYYFNNTGINPYNIDGVNKNPAEWKKHDDYIENFKSLEKLNIKLSIDIEKAIKTSERNECGCNYRFEHTFISKAIFIEITSDHNESSIWFLLPDDSMLLYHVGSYQLNNTKVVDFQLNNFGNDVQLPFACLRFDKDGNLIEKK